MNECTIWCILVFFCGMFFGTFIYPLLFEDK